MVFISTALKTKGSFLEKLRCLFLQLRVSLKKQNCMKVYVGGKKLYGVEIKSIVEEFYLERVA